MIDYVRIRDKMLMRQEGESLSLSVLSFSSDLKYNKLNKQ